jgi:hypothetical protein
MGRQINFWMTIEDEEEFVDILRKEDVLWTYRELKFEEEPALYELNNWKPVDNEQRLIVIRRHEKDLLKFEHIAVSPMEYGKESFEPWTMVGCGSSPAFEWNTCRRENGVITRGRIYLPTDWYDKKQHQVHQKNHELIKWFDRLTAKLRKNGEKYEYNGQYLMPHISRLLKEKRIKLGY